MRRTNSILLVATCVCLWSCDATDSQDEFVTAATSTPSGFSATDASGGLVRDEEGQIVSEDTDDWRTAPFFVGKVVVRPAYPNPAVAGGTVTVPIRILQFDDVSGGLVLRTLVGEQFPLLDELIDTSSPGERIMQFSVAQIGEAGLHRLFILDSFGEMVSYGDVLIE
ncbi:MAG: hypothetical protein HKN37_01020 [Rhodothermales bacterium]|nr:hypothetical protein [Rhodothermales bacterium]